MAFHSKQRPPIAIVEARGQVISWDLKTLTIIGKCWNCGAKKQNETARMTLAGLEGDFICDCGKTVMLAVPISGFK